ncbi:MAG: hypothetical protein NC406_02735 [Bacteroides sp.]|nr:hypothetical protein [Bacteroides sp.]MCM1094915.1 hypothetical protein [Terasakiella sp.]
MTIEEIDILKSIKEASRPGQATGLPLAESTPQPVPDKGLPAGYVPSETELRSYLDVWDTLDDYVDREKALAMIFRGDDAFAANIDLRHVIIKCATLNDFYATNIYKIVSVARKIASIDGFDHRLAAGDRSLVEEIATVDDRRYYSFATKYCSHHRPDLYPIYDRYVANVLAELRRRAPGMFRFRSKDALKDYPTFCEAIDDFRKAYGLEAYSYKYIDRYLWLLGKKYYRLYN